MARSRDISKVLSSNTTLATDAEVAASYLTLSSASSNYTPGLVPILKQSFTSSSEVVVSNVFSSTYENYKILVNLNSVSTSTIIRMRLRTSGGSNETGANYRGSGIRWNSSGAAYHGGNSQTSIAFYNDASNDARYVQIELRRPFLAEFKQYQLWSSDNSVNAFMNIGQPIFSTSYPSFAIIPDAGNITGSVQVYGYKEI
jgi:hypothetical protein